MQVILTEDVPNLGDMGDVVSVAAGYGRNFLIPNKLALPAHGQHARQFEHQKKQIDAKKARLREEALQAVKKIAGVSVTIPRQVGDDDKLYGSVTNRDIQQALAAEGQDVDRRKIVLTQPIRELGVYRVPVRLHSDVKTTVKVWVTAI